MSELSRERVAHEPHVIRLVSWGAILAGVVMALAIQLLLGLLGLGLGIASADPDGAAPDPTTFLSLAGLWTLFVVLAGIFVGAFAAGRLAGSPSRLDGALHGAVTWAVATLLAFYLLTSGISAVVGGAFGALGNTVSGLAGAGGQAVQAEGMPEELNAELDRLLSSAAPNRPSPAPEGVAGEAETETAPQAEVELRDAADAAPEILLGVPEDATEAEQQAAAEAIAEVRGVSRQQASSDLQTLRERYAELQQEAMAGAEQAAGYVSAAAFSASIVLLLGLVAGIFGGLVGRPRLLRV